MIIDETAAAPVFQIQSYCIHDGPGIRDVVFLKGCPLRCLWCANPESQNARPELMADPSRCTACGACAAVCPAGAISVVPAPAGFSAPGRPVAMTDGGLCTACGACAAVCPAGLREILGREQTVREVLEQVLGDQLFLTESGGGLTVSGGEPLAHPHFTANLLAAARAAGLHTAVESSCFASPAVIDRVFSQADLGLLDVKHMDSETHRRLTGVPNEQILANIRRIRRELETEVILRAPIVPGFNDAPEALRALGRFAAELDAPVHLLPYHRLGEHKNERLGRPFSLGVEPPDDEAMQRCLSLVAEAGAAVRVGSLVSK